MLWADFCLFNIILPPKREALKWSRRLFVFRNLGWAVNVLKVESTVWGNTSRYTPGYNFEINF